MERITVRTEAGYVCEVGVAVTTLDLSGIIVVEVDYDPDGVDEDTYLVHAVVFTTAGQGMVVQRSSAEDSAGMIEVTGLSGDPLDEDECVQRGLELLGLRVVAPAT